MEVLLDMVPEVITVQRNTSTRAIIDAIQKHRGHTIQLQQAQKVKQLLLQDGITQQEDNYACISRYLKRLEETNAGVTIDLLIDDD